MGRGRNDYGDGGLFYALFLSPKIRNCLAIKDYGILGGQKTFNGFEDVTRVLRRKNVFEKCKME